MMKYLLRLFIFFLLISITWGLLFGLWLGLYIGFATGTFYGLQGGFVFGFVLTVIGGLYDYLFRLHVFKRYGTKSFDLIQKRELLLVGNVKDLIQKSISILKMIRGVKKIYPNYDTHEIVAIRGTTWKTFGEKMELKFCPQGEKIELFIQSRPRLKTAIFDGGKNIENVEEFCSLMKRSYVG